MVTGIDYVPDDRAPQSPNKARQNDPQPLTVGGGGGFGLGSGGSVRHDFDVVVCSVSFALFMDIHLDVGCGGCVPAHGNVFNVTSPQSADGVLHCVLISAGDDFEPFEIQDRKRRTRHGR